MSNFSTNLNNIIGGGNLTYEQASDCFGAILNEQVSAMDQGAFLAAITTKGATPEEIRAIYDAIIRYDTNTVSPKVSRGITENSGTGMDRLKTFNISSAAAIYASCCGAIISRHASRALSGKCGAVDIMEKMGVCMDVSADTVSRSIEEVGIGMFNGGSAKIHPRALGRILSQITFGSVLNIAASLANPAPIRYALRGVNDEAMLVPVANIMKSVGISRAMVVCGLSERGEALIDEASTLGVTRYAQLSENGAITIGSFSPEDFGIRRARPEDVAALGDANAEAARFEGVISGSGTDSEIDIAALNAALILYISGEAPSIEAGLSNAYHIAGSGQGRKKLADWAQAQREA